jgi:signal transduction histidine kinase
MEAVGQLTGGLAHDFNNLLTGISGALELLQIRISQGRYKDVERYISTAQGAANRAAALTHRLLAFSRRQTLDPKATDVNRLVTSMTDLINNTLGPEVEMTMTTAPDLWTTLVDPNQLENALLNLCINARDAMPNGGRLKIETANRTFDSVQAFSFEMRPGGYVCLSVTDTGTGMSDEVVQRAFDPFYTTKPLGQGTGLGLSMIYGFAKQTGGQVLQLTGVPSAPLWGLIAMILRFVPYIGTFISAIFALILAAAVGSGWEMLLLTAVLVVLEHTASSLALDRKSGQLLM